MELNEKLWSQTIFGEPFPKENSRIPVFTYRRETECTCKGKHNPMDCKQGDLVPVMRYAYELRKWIPLARWIKGKGAHKYSEDFLKQLKPPPAPIECDVAINIRIFYASRRKDVNHSLICDLLQKGGVIRNDRQIRIHLIYGHTLDEKNPRCYIELWRIPGGHVRKASKKEIAEKTGVLF